MPEEVRSAPFVLEGKVVFSYEDAGASLFARIERSAELNADMYVVLHSYDERSWETGTGDPLAPGLHPELRQLDGKMVRVTIEII